MDSTLIVAVWLICAVGSYLIAGQKGAKDRGMWGVVGLILGPLGLLAAAVFAKRAS